MAPRGAHLYHNLAGKGYEDTEPGLLILSLVSTSAYPYKTNELVACVPPGSSVHGVFQARILEWGAIAFSDILHLNNKGRCYGLMGSLGRT